MNEALRIAILKRIEEKLRHIDDVVYELETQIKKEETNIYSRYTDQVLNLVKLYLETRSELNQEGFYQISKIMPSPNLPKYIKKDHLLNMLTTIVAGCVAGITTIREVLNQQAIPEEFANRLKGFRKELEAIESIEPDIYENLDKTFLEAEHGHYLASALISARVMDYIVSKFPGKKIDEKINNLKDAGLIDKDRKDEVRGLTFAAKKARDFVSHNIKIYPSPDDAMVMLGNAVKLAKIYTESKKMGGLKEEE